MREDAKAGQMTVSFGDLAYSNMIIVEGLVELLTKKGLLSRPEIEEPVKKLKLETKVDFIPKQ